MNELLLAGSPAPDFTARASDGETYQLSRLLAETRVLLIFYPGNNTPG
jgi:peroxiredoxin